MGKYIIGYSRFNIDLDVPDNASREDLLRAYYFKVGGPERAINHFFKYLQIVPDFTVEAQVVEENKEKDDTGKMCESTTS